jgi:hypothetical protein
MAEDQDIVNTSNPFCGKSRVGIQDVHCNVVGSPGMLGLRGRRGMRRYVLVGWEGTALDRARKVGADAKAPWTCVCSRYDLLKCTLL